MLVITEHQKNTKGETWGGQSKGKSYCLTERWHAGAESLSWLLSNQEKAFQRARG